MDSSITLVHQFSKEHTERSSLPSYEPVPRSDYDLYEHQGHDYQNQGQEYHPDDYQLEAKPWTRRKAFWITIIIATVAIVLAVVLPVVLVANKKHSGEVPTQSAQPTPTNKPNVSLLRLLVTRANVS